MQEGLRLETMERSQQGPFEVRGVGVGRVKFLIDIAGAGRRCRFCLRFPKPPKSISRKTRYLQVE